VESGLVVREVEGSCVRCSKEFNYSLNLRLLERLICIMKYNKEGTILIFSRHEGKL
jgi:hypothetical protein